MKDEMKQRALSPAVADLVSRSAAESEPWRSPTPSHAGQSHDHH